MSWASSPRLFRKRIFRVNLELKKQKQKQPNKPSVFSTGRRAPGDPGKGKCNASAVLATRTQDRASSLDYENREEKRGPVPRRVPDEGPEQCQECFHVPRRVDNQQGAQVLPEPGGGDEVILLLVPLPAWRSVALSSAL